MDNDEKIELLNKLATAIFGSQWEPALASQLGVKERYVIAWASGEILVPYSILRGLLSLTHDHANLLARTADLIARDLKREPAYQRIIYQSGTLLPEIRRDLYTDKREWYDIDGRLYALNENGTVIDIHGNERTCHGLSILPDGVTIADMLFARDEFINNNGEYD